MIKKTIKNFILSLILGRNFYITKNFLHNSDLHEDAVVYDPHNISNAVIGSRSYISINSLISNVEIGKFCSIGPNFVCGYGIHPTNGISTSPSFYSTAKQNGLSFVSKNKIEERKKIKIGNDVFIGINVTILDGVTVSDGAVIAAGSVVVKNVEPYAVYGGVPAKLIKYRFQEGAIVELLKLKWWDWSEEELRSVEENFFDIESFIAKNSAKNGENRA